MAEILNIVHPWMCLLAGLLVCSEKRIRYRFLWLVLSVLLACLIFYRNGQAEKPLWIYFITIPYWIWSWFLIRAVNTAMPGWRPSHNCHSETDILSETRSQVAGDPKHE